jgi:hypothetical protein
MELDLKEMRFVRRAVATAVILIVVAILAGFGAYNFKKKISKPYLVPDEIQQCIRCHTYGRTDHYIKPVPGESA